MTININIGNPQGPAGAAGVAVAIAANTIVANNTNATANPTGITASAARELLEVPSDTELAALLSPLASVAYVGANFAAISHNHSADNITSGALAKARQHAQTAYLDAGLANLEVWDDFSLQPDGDITNAATGQPYIVYPATGVRKPRVVSGKLTFDVGADGGYASVRLARPVTYMQCRFTLQGGTTTSGVVGLIPWVTDIGASLDLGQVAQTPAHLVVGHASFILGTFDGGAAGLEQRYDGTFSPVLATDGTTVHTVEMWIDSKRGFIILKLPDNSMHLIHDEKFKVPGYFACIEPYRYIPATDPLPAFVSWAASSSPDKLLEGYNLLASHLQVSEYYPTSDASLILNGSGTGTDGTRQEIVGTRKLVVVPSSGKVLVTASLFLDITSDGLAIANVGSGNTMFTTVVIGSKVAHSGWVTIQKIVDLSSYSNQVIQLSLFAQMFSGAGSIKIHQGGSDAMPAVFRLDSI